jgi:hypothetical protein
MVLSPLLFGIAVIGGCSGFLYRLWSTRRKQATPRRRERLSQAAPAGTRLSQLEAGDVAISGQVKATDAALRSPVTRRPCVAFELVVEAEGGFGRGLGDPARWRQAQSFLLVDETAEISVEPGDYYQLDLVAEIASQDWHDAWSDGFENLIALMRAAGIPVARLWAHRAKRMRYCEVVLAEGAWASVRGRAFRVVQPDGARAELRGPPARLVLRGHPSRPLLISDAAPL